jgi:hypothetical protein
MAEQDSKHWGIPFLGEGQSLGHQSFRVTIQQRLGKPGLAVTASLRAAAAETISRLEGSASRH